jgi:hypothetical protein
VLCSQYLTPFYTCVPKQINQIYAKAPSISSLRNLV